MSLDVGYIIMIAPIYIDRLPPDFTGMSYDKVRYHDYSANRN